MRHRRALRQARPRRRRTERGSRSLDAGAVTAAVVASVRHQDTPYDRLLMEGMDRDAARRQVSTAIDTVLAAWRACSVAASAAPCLTFCFSSPRYWPRPSISA